MIKNITFKLENIDTPNKLLIDFGPKHFKIRTVIKGKTSETFELPNTLFHISENRVQNLEREFKDAFAMKSGMFTKQEIEAAQLLLQADEKLVDLSDKFQVERAYTNLFEQIPGFLGFDFRTDDIDFEAWSVFLTFPVTQNFDELLKHHLNILKTLGFIYIRPEDYLTSSFYSQKGLIGAENVKHKYGILINVSDTTEVGVFDEELIENGYSQLSLGVNTVIEYCLAILRDLNIRGFKRELLEEWVQADGTCMNDAQTVIKNIRKKDVDIKIILNSPYILFDYYKVTSLKNDPNSIPNGIVTLLQSQKKIKKNINKILSNVIIVGPGSVYRGFDFALKSSLAQELGTSSINVLQGTDPTNSEINGLNEYLTTVESPECYNVTKIEIDDQTRKAYEKQFSGQIKEIDSILKNIKAKNYYNPDQLIHLNLELINVMKIIKTMPEGLDTIIESRVFTETQKFAKEFGKQLKGYKKNAEKSFESASETIQNLSTISNRINNFSIPFLVQLLSNQLSSVQVEVRNIRALFEEKMIKENLKIVLKEIDKTLAKEGWISVDDLSQASKLHYDLILKIKDNILQEKQELGYIDGRFVKYDFGITLQSYQFLDNIMESIYQKVTNNESFELKSDFEQALEHCEFMLRGFQLLNENDYLESVIVRKEYLLEERKQIFGN